MMTESAAMGSRQASPTIGPLALAFLLLLSACSQAERRPRNVLLISVDTLRADHLGSYGYARETSPFLDRLAATGVRFEQVRTPAGWTLPAHVSLLTSRYPEYHGVVTHTRRLPETMSTLAGVLRSAGYATCGIVNSIYLRRKFGFARDFEEYFELIPRDFADDTFVNRSFTAAEVTDRVVDWLEQERKRPFFLLVHYFDPHSDYAPPPPYDSLFASDYTGNMDGRYERMRPHIKYLRASLDHPPASAQDIEFLRALYDGEIRFVDDQISRIGAALRRRNLEDTTLVVVTADHGEEFGDHGSLEGHGWTLYEEVLRVPLIMRFPQRPERREIAAAASLVDVAPTILEWAGLQVPEQWQGRSLLPPMDGEELAHALQFAHTARFMTKRSVYRAPYKLIETEPAAARPWLLSDPAGFELYDLSADPSERTELSARLPGVLEELQRHLDDFRRGSGPGKSSEAPVVLTPEEIEQLEAMGYIHR